jgi:predicted amidohydrolase
VSEICLACKENNIWAIATDTIREKAGIFKTSILIGRDGEIKGKYHKINLYDDYTKKGRNTFVFETDFAKIGIVICWDLAFPQLFSKLKRRGAEIVFCPSYWCYEDSAHSKNHKKMEKKIVKSLIVSRAFENLMFFSFVSPIDDNKELISYSAISSPHGIIAEIENEGLLIKRLNLAEIKKFEKIYPNKETKPRN